MVISRFVGIDGDGLAELCECVVITLFNPRNLSQYVIFVIFLHRILERMGVRTVVGRKGRGGP